MTIILEKMQNLKSICGQPLLFPSLKRVDMIKCPKLERLPFELDRATRLKTLFMKECTKMVEILVVQASEVSNLHAQKHYMFCSLRVIILENM